MTASRPVEGCHIFFLVEETQALASTAQFLERRDVHVELFSDVREFLLACSERTPEFVAFSVNHHNPRLSDVINKFIAGRICNVIVFAEKPDRKTLPLIRRFKKAHSLMGALSGPALLLKMRKILRRQERPQADSFVLEILSPAQEEDPSIQVSGDKGAPEQLTTDLRRRGAGPSLIQSSPSPTPKESLIWERKGRLGKGPLHLFRGEKSSQKFNQSASEPSLQVQIYDAAYKELAQWIERGLKQTLTEGPPEELVLLPETTQRVAVVRIQDGPHSGYVLVTSGGDQQLEESLAGDLLKNLKNLKSFPDGPQWGSFRVLDMRVSDIVHWSSTTAQADFLGTHLNSEILASFVASSEEIPKLVQTLEGHLNIPADLLKPGVPLDYDTYLHLILNDKLIPYVPKGDSFRAKQLIKLQRENYPVLIKEKDLVHFENQFLRDLLNLGASKPRGKKAA